jgi:hypothetical protein
MLTVVDANGRIVSLIVRQVVALAAFVTLIGVPFGARSAVQPYEIPAFVALDYRAYPQRGLGPESIPMLRWNAASSSFEAVSKAGSNLPKQ